MRKFLTWLVLAPFALAVILFAVSNREFVVLRLWPLDYEVQLPVFAVGCAGLLFGFLWGAATAWFSGGAIRARARREAARAEMAERETAHLKTQVERLEAQARGRAAEAGRPGLPAAVTPPPAGADLPRAL